jgi:23S rRNA (guanosine2251-2'-O)-methyltransferase
VSRPGPKRGGRKPSRPPGRKPATGKTPAAKTPARKPPATRGAAPRRPPAGRGSAPRPPVRDRAPSPARRNQHRGLGGDQVEGRQAVRELLLAGRRRVHELLMASDLDPAPVLDEIRELAAEARVPIKEVARTRLEAQARTEAPQGVLALAAELPEADLDDLARSGPVGRPPFLVALDGVTDPGNLGALLRNAEGAGATGIVLPKHRSVHVTPAAAKAAAGAIEHLPIALVGGLPAALARLRELGVWVVGLDGSADQPLWSLDLGDEPVALVLGAEGSGLGRLVRERCDAVVAIPLAGHLGSLNVAAAGALACFEVARRRSPG